MDGEDQVALAPAVLGYATQPLPGGGLVCDLPCLPCGDALSGAGMGGGGGDGTTGAHALRATPVCGDVLDEKGPLAFGGCFPWAGRRVETTCTWVVFGATGGVGGAAVTG